MSLEIFRIQAEQLRIANALRTAEQFRWENVANAFLDLYEDTLRLKSEDEVTHFHPDFVSTPPNTGRSRLARFTAGVLQHLLATR